MENTGGKFEDKTEGLGLTGFRSWWWSIAEGDFDGDSDPDYLIGNLGKNTKFKASKEKPFMVFQNDFDKNGTNDIVLANFYGDKKVPVRGRECTSEQMPFVAEKFPTFEGFAKATVNDIYPEETMASALKYEIHSFKSVFLRNDGGGFTKTPLPMEAQFFPIRDILILDVNQDGHQDALLTGNLYGAEVETMRYDAGIGLCLIGDGQGGFQPLNVGESGFFNPYDGRSLAAFHENGKWMVLTGNNQGPLQVFELAGN